jgi:hypothetical protein
METLKGLVYLETAHGEDTWCLAVEHPDGERTRIIRCKSVKSVEREEGTKTSHKRGGLWIFKAFRFKGKVDSIVTNPRPITEIWSHMPENVFQRIPVSELRKLKEWIDLEH